MARMPWRRTLHLLHRSLLPPPARPAAPLSEELVSKTASWALLTRDAHFSSRDHRSDSCSQVCGNGLGDEWVMANGRRSFHATGIQHMARQNFYETLGLQKGASPKDIKSAYYQLAKKWHPDVNKGNADAEKKFQEIQQAYEVLKDDEKRAMYDQVGHEAFEQAAAGGAPGGGPGGGGPGGFGGFDETIFGDAFGGGMDEMFSRVFGGGARESRPHVQVQLDLTFREAVQGCSKVVKIQTYVRCQACNGSGLPPGVQPQTCKQCKGRGRVVMQQGFFTFESTCPACDGSGQMVKEHCRACGGAGVVKGNREVRVEIPAGVESGTTLKIHGEGG